MANISIHCFISGKVQGVFFRYSTSLKAKSLDITGWVRNLEDGRVELVASGEQEQIEELYQWLFEGPVNAEVTSVEREDIALQAFDDFNSIH